MGRGLLINVPLVVVGLLALTVYLPETRSERPQPADDPGIVLSSTGLVAVIYGLIQAGQDGWTSPSVVAPVLAGVALLAAFVAWERRSTHPIVDLALSSNRDFTIAAALSTVANFALFGLLFVMPRYFQDVGGLGPARHRRSTSAEDRRHGRRDPDRESPTSSTAPRSRRPSGRRSSTVWTPCSRSPQP